MIRLPRRSPSFASVMLRAALQHPQIVTMRCHSGNMYGSGGDVDEEQDIVRDETLIDRLDRTESRSHRSAAPVSDLSEFQARKRGRHEFMLSEAARTHGCPDDSDNGVRASGARGRTYAR